MYGDAPLEIECNALVVAGARVANDGLELALLALRAAGSLSGIVTIRAVGDCYAPGAIFNAVYAGHRLAREFDQDIDRDRVGYLRERVSPA